MATRPARMPLHRKLGSGFLYFSHMMHMAVTAPAAEDSAVFTAMRAMFGSVADRVLPALKPNQPRARKSVPVMYIGTLCAGSGVGWPPGRYLPMRGPSRYAPTSDVPPPTMWTTEEPAKSTWP